MFCLCCVQSTYLSFERILEYSVVCVLNCQMHAYIKMGHLMLGVVLSWRFVYF